MDPADVGLPLTAVLRRAGLPLNTRCGERLLCNACLVEVLTGEEWQPVPGCRVIVEQEMDVRISARSLLTYAPQVVSEFRVNVPLAQNPDPAMDGLAAVVDIGTTTIAVCLVDLGSGMIVGRSSGFNRQMHWGEDVLTRIRRCQDDMAALTDMRAAVATSISSLTQEALESSSRPQDSVGGFVLAGNTTMLHLALGVDPTPMGVAPFKPSFLNCLNVTADRMGLSRFPLPVWLLPGSSAYVGADVIAGVVATGLAYEEGPSLLVDVGTNGEIVLRSNGAMLACATAAGPAFEGCGLTSGIRAGDGAIAHLRIDEKEVWTEVIGPPGTRASGICGSGYVDFLSEGRFVGLLSEQGRFRRATWSEDKLETTEDGLRFRLASGRGRRPITITEKDVSRLLQAKAAIAAGIRTLLRRANLRAADIQTVYLAGGFGMHLSIENAIACGLLPGFEAGQVQVVGNTALAGAYMAALDHALVDELDRVAREIEIVELNLDPSFEEEFIDQLSLP